MVQLEFGSIHTFGFRILCRKVTNPILNKTKNTNRITVIFAFNYGSKSELINAFKKIYKNKKNIITDELISNNLYTKNIPDPDILIRTGGEKRLSNFLLWQLSYAELFFLDKNWPDFNSSDLKKIIKNYKILLLLIIFLIGLLTLVISSCEDSLSGLIVFCEIDLLRYLFLALMQALINFSFS